MERFKDLAQLEGLKQSEDALLVLFGGQKCTVCDSIKPKLIELMIEHYPKIKLVYIDCHLTTEICSQNRVLSLPTLEVYFAGKLILEEIRTFSLQKVVNDLARPYRMCFFKLDETSNL